MSGGERDTGLLVISLLLLLLTAVWFPAAILVARVCAVQMQWSKEKMLQALAASELAESDTPTLTEMLAADTMPSGTSTRPLEVILPGAGDPPPDAPADVADAMPAETPNDADGAPLD